MLLPTPTPMTSEMPPSWDPYRFSAKVIFWGVLLSALLHAGILVSTVLLSKRSKTQETPQLQPIEVSVINQLPTIQTLQQPSKEPPKDAKFASDKNMRADEDTSPTSSPSNVPKSGGKPQQEKKLFTLNQKD